VAALPLVALTATSAEGLTPAPGRDTGSLLGKRYRAVSDETLEILVTKAGAGTLADADTPARPQGGETAAGQRLTSGPIVKALGSSRPVASLHSRTTSSLNPCGEGARRSIFHFVAMPARSLAQPQTTRYL